MKPICLLSTVLVGTMLVATTACNLAAIPADLAALATQVQTDKDLIEALVHDLKTTPPSKGPAVDLQSSQDQYDEARATQQGYITAVRLAVETGNKHADLGHAADLAEVAAERFIETAANILQQREGRSGATQVVHRSLSSTTPSSSPAHRTIQYSRKVHKLIISMPKGVRSTALDDMERRAQWRPWDQL